jgi:hypothetical protein
MLSDGTKRKAVSWVSPGQEVLFADVLDVLCEVAAELCLTRT